MTLTHTILTHTHNSDTSASKMFVTVTSGIVVHLKVKCDSDICDSDICDICDSDIYDSDICDSDICDSDV